MNVGAVIATLSCGATLREMTPDVAPGAPEQKPGRGLGEGAGSEGEGWVIVCSGRRVNCHGLPCCEGAREAVRAYAVWREKKHVPARAAQQDAALSDGNRNATDVGDLQAEAGFPVAIQPAHDADADSGPVSGDGTPCVQNAEREPGHGNREGDVFAADMQRYLSAVHAGDNNATVPAMPAQSKREDGGL